MATPPGGQGDQRIFVGAFVTGELLEPIQAIRAAHDPVTAAITAPHVTLAGTYARAARDGGPARPGATMEAIDRLQQLDGRVPRFDLVAGGIAVFPGGTVLHLQIAPTPELLAARQALLAVLGPDKHGTRFTPHLTLAMRLPSSETRALCVELQGSAWHTERHAIPIDALWLMQRGPGDRAWRYAYRLALA